MEAASKSTHRPASLAWIHASARLVGLIAFAALVHGCGNPSANKRVIKMALESNSGVEESSGDASAVEIPINVVSSSAAPVAGASAAAPESTSRSSSLPTSLPTPPATPTPAAECPKAHLAINGRCLSTYAVWQCTRQQISTVNERIYVRDIKECDKAGYRLSENSPMFLGAEGAGKVIWRYYRKKPDGFYLHFYYPEGLVGPTAEGPVWEIFSEPPQGYKYWTIVRCVSTTGDGREWFDRHEMFCSYGIAGRYAGIVGYAAWLEKIK